VRPEVLNTGYSRRVRILFRLIGSMTGGPVPDAARYTFYRPDFLGSWLKRLTHEAMRGTSAWSVGERELMAAYVSHHNSSEFCVDTHSATATRALGDRTMVTLVLHDLESAPVPEPLRATLRLLGTLTREGTVTPDDVRMALASGASTEQVEQALAVCFAFNVINRLADAFDFARLTAEGYAKGARYLLKHGYR
jgi:AhpD family alkylhydroperoxidase